LSRTKWFGEHLSPLDSVRLVQYVQSPQGDPRFGFIRKNFQTKIVDLTATEDDIFRQFGKNTQYKIRRAERDHVICRFDGDPGTFVRFNNRVAQQQGRRPIPAGLVEAAAAQVCISWAQLGELVLVMHCTLLDRRLRRARLGYSCSRYVLEDSSEVRNAIGRANRLLHFEDMRHFKRQGMAIYDFGGYSSDPRNRKTMAINKFKDGFGGRLAVENNYVSYALFLAHLGRELLAALRRPRDGGPDEDAP
jgi:hypothetical protein